MSQKIFLEQGNIKEVKCNHLIIRGVVPLSHVNDTASLHVGGLGTAFIKDVLRVPNTWFKWMNFDDGNQADGRVFTSSADGTVRWASKLFDTNNVPELVAGPSDNHIHTFHNIGIGVTNPTEYFHIETTSVGTGARIGNLKLGVWSGNNDYTYLIHNDLKLEDASYMLRGNKTGEVALNSKNTLSLKINDVEGVTMLKNEPNNEIRVGIGTADPSVQFHVKKDVRIGGNLYVDGSTIIVQSEVVTIADALVRFGNDNPGNTHDLGWYGQYVDTGVTKFSGLFINHADTNKFHLFRNLTEEPNTTGTIATTHASYDLADLKLGYVYCDDGVILMGEDSRVKFGPNSHLRFTTDNGFDKIFFTKEGKIGVGITNPEANVHIFGTLACNDLVGIGVTNCDVSLDTNKTDAFRMPYGDVSERPTGKNGLLRYNTEYVQFEGFSGGSWQALSGMIDTDRDTYILTERLPGNPDEDKIWYYTAGAIRGVVNSNGNFGMNETNPSIILECNTNDGILIPKGNSTERPTGRQGIIRYNTELDRFEGYGAGNAWGSLGGVVDIDQDTYITAERLGIWDEDHLWFHTNTDLRMIIRNNGNVGIGVTNPDFPLTLFPDTDSKAKFGRAHVGYVGRSDEASFAHIDSATSISYALSQLSDGTTLLNSADQKNIEFLHNNTRKAILKDGKLGINVDTPSEKLEVGGNIRVVDTFHVATNELRALIGITGTINVSTNMTINGNLTVNGTSTTVNTTDITVDDPLICLADNNTTTDSVDIGFYGKYFYDGSTEYTGLFRDASSSDTRYKLFTQLAVEPTTGLINTAGSGYTKGILELNILDAETIDYPVNLSFRDSTNKTTHVTFKTTGQVGIGTNNPSFPLHVTKENTGNWSAKFHNGYAHTLIANESGYGMSINSGVDVNNDTKYILQCRTDFTAANNFTPYIFYVQNDGYVGINTNGPTDQLDIRGVGYGDGARISSAKVGNWINGTALESDAMFGHINFGRAAYDSANSYGCALRQNEDGSTYLNAASTKQIDFCIDNSRTGGIASDGRWGIGAGVTAPTTLLHVGGTAFFEGDVLIKGVLKFTGPAATDLKIQDSIIMLASENNSDLYDIGIFGKYVTDGETEYTGIFRDASDSGKWKLFTGLVDDPAGPNNIDTQSMGFTPTTLVLGDLEAQNVYTNLKMGIGITTPVVALQIEKTDAIKIPKGNTSERPTSNASEHRGYIRYNSELDIFEGFGAGNAWNTLGGVTDIDQDTYVSAENSAGADNDEIKMITAGSERVRVTSTGLVGINTPSPTEYLDVNGNVRCTSFITTSDRRVKTDITEMKPYKCLFNISNIPIYRYKFNEMYKNSCGLKDKVYIGPIAQEVEKIIPEAVSTSPKSIPDKITGLINYIPDFKSIDNNILIAQLIGSVKALTGAYVQLDTKYQKKINELKERINILEQR